MRALLMILALLSLAANPCVPKDVNERHTTKAQKRAVFARAGVAYDKAHRPLYVVDHRIPLELGGQDEVANMQLQSKADGKAKDKVEQFLARCVFCQHETLLTDAQTAVLAWRCVDPGGQCPGHPLPRAIAGECNR